MSTVLQSEQVRLSEVISALSYALDITEGQPQGHAVRSCLIGMQIAQELQMDRDEQASLFYALLMKDLGCSSNAARVCWLFQADDRVIKRDVKLIDWSSKLATATFTIGHVLPGKSWIRRLFKVAKMAPSSEATNQSMVKVRCERGAEIARLLGFPEDTAQAILALDEQWCGAGYPSGQKGDEIPLAARICSLSQTMEVFMAEHGVDKAMNVARQRSGRWFDPELVKVFANIATAPRFAEMIFDGDSRKLLQTLEPEDHVEQVDEPMLDRIAFAFSKVIDAKSPWTSRHSEGVADIAVGISQVMGFSEERQREIRRAGLLHDIGKLGVSNLILDKPGKLTDAEFEQMRAHALYTQQILGRVSSFRRFADYASAHHERLDGQGYHRGLPEDEIPIEARILAVADVCEALTADRPYRKGMEAGQVIGVLKKDCGTAFCPRVVASFLNFANNSDLFEQLKRRGDGSPSA